MAFFFNDAIAEEKTKPAPRRGNLAASAAKKGQIPVYTLEKMGCQACPRNDDEKRLQSPKMKPSGVDAPSIYLLGGSPSEADDEMNWHWSSREGEEILKQFGKSYVEGEVRSNYITQCHGDQTQVEITCCRSRVVGDIEQSKPEIIVAVGDAALQWLLGPTEKPVNALKLRGRVFPVKVGNHKCLASVLIWPNYVHGKQRKYPGPHELCLAADVRMIKDLLRDPSNLNHNLTVVEGPYDAGCEIITGHEPGDVQRLEQALKIVLRARRNAIDFETNGLRPYRLAPPILATVAVGTYEYTVAFPLDHPDGWQTDGQRRRAWELFIDYLLQAGRLTAHHVGMEMDWLQYHLGPKAIRELHWNCTMSMAHTLDERAGTKSLEILSLMYMGFNLKAQSKLDTKKILSYPIKQVLRYNAMDAKYTDLLDRILEPFVHERPEYVVEHDRKVRLAPTLILTSARGVPVNLKVAKQKQAELLEEVRRLDARLDKLPEIRQFRQKFGKPFSASNSDHVLLLMKDQLKRDEVKVVDRRTGAISYSTGEELLAMIPAGEVPSAPIILEHRGVSKLNGTYVEPVLSGKIVDPDGRIRCSYGSMIAVTGRLNSDDPNLQNWPKRKFKHIREMIQALFMAIDYGQIEFRVIGMASGDENLVRACWTGYDVHKFWAERMVDLYPKIKDRICKEFGVDWDEKGLKTLRQETKNQWVFPQFFGSMVESCADNLKLPLDVAQELAGEFWDEFRTTKAWQEKLIRSYEKNLYVETLSGRRRRGAMSKNEIINMPIQGTAADIVTTAMCAVSERAYELEMPDAVPSINVHDDLTFEVQEDTIDMVLDMVAPEMCKHRFPWINVPLLIEVSVGTDWANLTEIKKFSSDQLFNLRNPYA